MPAILAPSALTRRLIGVTALAAWVSACGDGATDVDCAFFAGDNCWKASVTEAYGCIPEGAEGTFNADRTTCTFADGAEVNFATAAPVGIEGDYVFDFDVTDASGQLCASYRELGADGDDGFSLETAGGELVEEVMGARVVLSCPDGESFSIGAFAAFECDLSTLPGHFYATSGDSLSFAFNGSTESRTLFSCGP